MVMLCFPTDDDEAPADTRLHRDFFGMHRFEWRGPDGTVEDIEFRIGHGDMIRLLRSCGFAVEDLIEIQAPAVDQGHQPYVPLEWAGVGRAPKRGRRGSSTRVGPDLLGPVPSLQPPRQGPMDQRGTTVTEQRTPGALATRASAVSRGRSSCSANAT